MRKWLSTRTIAIGAAMMFSGFALAPALAQRGNDWDWDGNFRRLARLNAGTFITVRTTQTITSNRADGRMFAGVVNDDVWDEYGRLSVPAIPRGARAMMTVRTRRDGDLVLDLDSIFANGQRYTVSAAPERIESDNSRRGDNAAALTGGGALLGTIIGAVAGGGKGAAVGAAAGAATGLGIAYSGRSIRVPAGSVLTFQLDQGLTIGRPVRGTSGTYPRH